MKVTVQAGLRELDVTTHLFVVQGRGLQCLPSINTLARVS